MNEPLPDRDLLALVDRLLLEQGRLDPFELLLAAGLLAYQDYEAWRMGRMPDIQGALSVAPGEAAGLLERAAAYARGQKLAATSLEHNGWGGLDQPLRIGTDAGLIRGCAAAFAPRMIATNWTCSMTAVPCCWRKRSAAASPSAAPTPHGSRSRG